jgi:predicted nucleic acid-binding protein
VRFVDTNVLLYAVSTAPEEDRKAHVARALLNDTDLALSTQVLLEFYVQATRPTRAERLTHEQAQGLVEAFLRFPIQETTVPLVLASLRARERFGISLWDASIVEAARFLGCRVVLSEDLQHGQDLAGVRVVDPFRTQA